MEGRLRFSCKQDTVNDYRKYISQHKRKNINPDCLVLKINYILEKYDYNTTNL
jgi:hypothetical protein